MNKNILSIIILILSFFCITLSASVQTKANSSPSVQTKATPSTSEPVKVAEETRALIQLSDVLTDPSTLEPLIPHAIGSGITLRVFTIILEYLVSQRNNLTEAGITSLTTIITAILAYPEMQDPSDDYLLAKTKLTELLDTLNS